MAVPDQIFAGQASQGGFTSLVLPSALELNPVDATWGLGWLKVRTNLDGFTNPDNVEVIAYSGDGSAVSSTLTRDGVSSVRIVVVPVYADAMVVGVWQSSQWDGFLIKHSSAASLALSESFKTHLDAIRIAAYASGGAGSSADFDLTEYNSLVYSQLSFDYLWPQDVYITTQDNTRRPIFGSGAHAGETTPSGTSWRLDLTTSSRFADAVDQVPTINAALEGSAFYNGFNGADARPYMLQQKVGAGDWASWSNGLQTADPVTAINPDWRIFLDPFGYDYVGDSFFPVVSVPFSDRRPWFLSEFGMTIT